MEEGCFEVEAHDLEVEVGSVGKENTDTTELNDRSIRFSEILGSLAKSLRDESCFLLSSYNRTIRVIFVVVRPADTDGFTPRWKRGPFKGVSGFKAIVFPLHSRMPYEVVWPINCFMVGVRGF